MIDDAAGSEDLVISPRDASVYLEVR